MADTDFPCVLTVHIPFPSHRLATAALRALSVDQELSPLVRRSFALVHSLSTSSAPSPPSQPIQHISPADHSTTPNLQMILKTEYRATTNRMLRVAVNGFFESLGTTIQVMKDLDLEIVHEKGLESLEGAQGVEEGMKGGDC